MGEISEKMRKETVKKLAGMERNRIDFSSMCHSSVFEEKKRKYKANGKREIKAFYQGTY